MFIITLALEFDEGDLLGTRVLEDIHPLLRVEELGGELGGEVGVLEVRRIVLGHEVPHCVHSLLRVVLGLRLAGSPVVPEPFVHKAGH